MSETTMDAFDPDDTRGSRQRRLSALMDGQASAADVQMLLAAWANDANLRADWHAYHVVGDVLRTADLSPRVSEGGVADAAFLTKLRATLAAEPVVLSPEAAASVTSPPVESKSWTAWRAPMAAAAGVVAVVGALVGTRVTLPPTTAATSTTSSPSLASSTPDRVAPGAASATVVTVNDQRLVRDATLDRYLAQHRQYQDAGFASVPGGVVRSVSTLAPER